ncbi:hypothetical protein [Burkholderia ubonensis]|uniref:hypothetical protein n=1 Tax=Burkholderia ubonensis TaxID=101571 RepID=UPI000A7C81C0|nr:hypothetical protein [Burkholderia ubonensis]
MIDDDLVVDLYEASDALAGGDASRIIRLLPHIKNRELYCERPLLFYVADSVVTLEFLAANGVDFHQTHGVTGDSLLHHVAADCDQDAFEWVLAWHRINNIVDVVDRNGITTLSMLLKFGACERARQLIESGANIYSISENGSTPVRQAVFCLDGEDGAIKCLDMLFAEGLTINDTELDSLVEAARQIDRSRLAQWLEGKKTSPSRTI